MSGKILRQYLIRLIAFSALVSMAIPAFAQSKVSASVQPARVTVGDSVSYQVSVELTGAGQPSVAVPVIRSDTGLSTPSPAGQQSSVETYIENGNFRSVQKVIYNYSIRTSKEGTFTIPPATVTLNGKTYETEPVELTVQAVPKATNVPAELQGLVAPPNVSGNPELQRKLTGGLFVLPVLSKTDPYNGEQIRISYHLVIEPQALQAAGLQPRTNLDGVQIPPMNEFITEELFPFPQDLKFQERKIGGKLYLVAPVYEAVIASTKTGKLQIEPFQISMFFSQRGSQQRQLPAPFANDPFFSSMAPMGMFGGNSVQVIAQSPPLTVDVKPVPENGKPADFAGAVGEFKLSAVVDKKQARAYDDTVALTVKIEGEGNTESLSPPTLPPIAGFTVLGDPAMNTTGKKVGDKYISSKTFEYTLRPTTPGAEKIPPIELSYFDPTTETYKEVATDPIPMQILPGTHPAPPPAPAAPADENSTQKEQQPEAYLRYISTETLQAPGAGLGWVWGPLGVALFLVPPAIVGLAGAVAFSRSRTGHREVDPHKLARAASQQRLKAAERDLAAKDSPAMASNLAEGIRLHFASRFGISEGEVTLPEIEERLSRAGAPSELVTKITEILETCDSAHYAPTAQLHADARQIYHEALQALKQSEAYV